MSCIYPFAEGQIMENLGKLTYESEERALLAAEKELGFKGRMIDWENYLKTF